jgi:two-component system, NtrC family, response regulator AtoC
LDSEAKVEAGMSEDFKLIGVSPNIRRTRELIEQVAETGLNVLVCGETGTGKELVVSSLYQRSNRFGKPFIKVNCAALPDTLLESEMFGYERGAFTGAEENRRGKFEQAAGGMLFLDEIGDMSLPLQSKLLHVLQGGDFMPLGSERSMQADVWVAAATNHNLAQKVERGGFRQDLYYRLSVIVISLEPLRNRSEDVPVLIDHYLRKYADDLNRKRTTGLSQSAIAKLTAYSWPGNVRELQNVLKRVIVLGEAEEAIDGMLAGVIRDQNLGGRNASPLRPGTFLDALAAGGERLDLSQLALKKIRKKALDQVERELIRHVLVKTGWNRSRASRILNVSYKTLLQKIGELEISPPPELA